MQNEQMPLPQPVVSILVVGYNSSAVIGACLSAIPASISGQTYETLFIDNGDGSTEAFVRQNFPQVSIVPSRGNIGFAAGNNLLAAAAQGKFLLLLNPDVEMKPGALDNLLQGAARYPDAAAWGGVTLDNQDRPDAGNSVHIPSLKEMMSRTLGRSSAGQSQIDPLKQDSKVRALSGAFVMFSRSAWDDAGGLDERYFLYCEEVDLFYRLTKKKYVFWRIASSLVNHDIGHGQSSSPTRELLLNAGVMQFTRLHWNKQRSFMAFLLIWISAVQRVIAGKILSTKRPEMAYIANKHSLIATRPNYWRFGYDPKRGLLTKLQITK